MLRKRQLAGSRSFRRRGGGYASIGCYFSPALAAEEITDREHGEKWIRERIEEEMKGEEEV